MPSLKFQTLNHLRRIRPQPLLPPSLPRVAIRTAALKTAGGSSFLGKDMPFSRLGRGNCPWDGKNFSITDNRIFKARFEKYLNAPPQTTELDKKYQAIISKIMDRLAPGKVTPQSMDDAFNLLAKASQFADDAHCATPSLSRSFRPGGRSTTTSA